jgi:hypothetical protein
LPKIIKIKIYKTIILPVVLYGYETWSLILRVFENRVLRDDVIGSWRKLHNEELHNLQSPADIMRMIKLRRVRWAGHVAHGGEEVCIQGFGEIARSK